MRRAAITTVVGLCLAFGSVASAQTTWVVDPGGGGDFTTIQACILAASDADTCLVNAGTYLEQVDFSGKDIGVVSSSGPDDTTIDGNGASGNVVTFAGGESEDAVLDGFTVRGAGGMPAAASAVYCSGSSPTIVDCIVTGNTSMIGRAGIHCVSASPRIRNCTIRGNSGSGVFSSVGGGGIYLSASSPEITDSTISENSLSCYKCFSYGGGIYIGNASSPVIRNCVISDNELHASGVTIPGPSSFGGGIYAAASDPVITNSVIRGNTTDGLVMYGAGLAMVSSSPTLTNTVFTENNHADGSGLFPSYGGALYASDSAPLVTNAILWGDSAQNGPEIFEEEAGSVEVAYSDIQGSWAGTGNLDQNPLFTGAGDVHLTAGSPCIDSGNNAAPEIPAVDMDGENRIQDGNGDGSAVVDMGADEVSGGAPAWAAASTIPTDRGERSRVPVSRCGNALLALVIPLAVVLLRRRVRGRA